MRGRNLTTDNPPHSSIERKTSHKEISLKYTSLRASFMTCNKESSTLKARQLTGIISRQVKETVFCICDYNFDLDFRSFQT